MKKRIFKTVLLVVLIVAVLAVGYVYGIRYIGEHLQNTQQKEGDTLPADSYFEIRYFDVGEGDAALVNCDGHYLLIDGGSPENSSLIYSYMEKHEIRHLDYIICSHGHADHVGGLSGALQYASVGTAYAPVKEHENLSFKSFAKYLEKQGKQITIPAPGESFPLSNAEVTFIGPVDMSLAVDNENNSSLIVKVEYGNTSFLFTGDAEIGEELSVVESGANLRSTVLKVAHHGSYTSSCSDFLDAVEPEYAVISVGKDNEYGHPHDGPVERLEEICRGVYRTDMLGDIVCSSDGLNVTFSYAKSVS